MKLSDDFDLFMDTNFPELDETSDSGKFVYNAMYRAYLFGYKTSAIDSVEKIKTRFKELNDQSSN